jgi:hypothetical protein
MALIPQKSRPISTQVIRERIGPNRVPKDRSFLAMTAPYPGNKSTNTSDNQVQAIDQVLCGTYSPAAAPTQATGITAGAFKLWNITSGEAGHAPDMIPGDVWEFLSQDNIVGTTPDALTNSGLLVLGVYVVGANPYDLALLLYNSTAGTLSTPAGYIPTLLVQRYTNLTTDPNAIY